MNAKQDFIAILEKYGFAWNDAWEQAFAGIDKLITQLKQAQGK